MLNIIKNKNKTAAWFVSNCKSTPSKRNELVKKLQENGIEVDVYGKCGNLTLPRNSAHELRLLEDNYKFYLSFENSLCVDYVTEKLFKVMNSIVIPVAFSGADLNRFVPKKSYINANEFKTVEELAKQLKFLAENPEEYVKYFWWRKNYRVRTPSYDCKICEFFNNPRLFYKRESYSNLNDWYSKDSCGKLNIKF